MKKNQTVLKLHRDVIRNLASSEIREAAGGVSRPAICTLITGASCDCTQICTG
jgi:hypothetical protein